MEIIIYLGNKQMKVASFNDDAKASEVLTELSGENQPNLKVFGFEAEQELTHKDEIKSYKALVVHSCKKVQIEVLYPGLPSYIHTYSPVVPVKNIRKDAIKKLGIDEETSKKLELYENQQQDAKLNSNYPVGYYSNSETCSARFYLLDPNAFQG